MSSTCELGFYICSECHKVVLALLTTKRGRHLDPVKPRGSKRALSLTHASTSGDNSKRKKVTASTRGQWAPGLGLHEPRVDLRIRQSVPACAARRVRAVPPSHSAGREASASAQGVPRAYRLP